MFIVVLQKWEKKYVKILIIINDKLIITPIFIKQAPDEDVLHHFTCFVNSNGKLVELDGRKKGPIVRGETTSDNFKRV